MYTVVGMRDGEPVVVQVGAGECPFEASVGITRGYIIRDGAVMAIIMDNGDICEW